MAFDTTLLSPVSNGFDPKLLTPVGGGQPSSVLNRFQSGLPKSNYPDVQKDMESTPYLMQHPVLAAINTTLQQLYSPPRPIQDWQPTTQLGGYGKEIANQANLGNVAMLGGAGAGLKMLAPQVAKVIGTGLGLGFAGQQVINATGEAAYGDPKTKYGTAAADLTTGIGLPLVGLGVSKLFGDLVPQQQPPRIPNPGDADYAAYFNSLSSRSPASNIKVENKPSVPTAQSATTASPFDKGKLFQDSQTVNTALQSAGLEKPLNPGGAMENLSPDLQAQHVANAGPQAAGWVGFKPKTRLQILEDKIRANQQTPQEFQEYVKLSSSTPASTTEYTTPLQKKIGQLLAAKQQKQNEKENVKGQVPQLQTGSNVSQVQGSEEQVRPQEVNAGQVQKKTEGKIPGAVGRTKQSGGGGDVKGDAGFVIAPKEMWKTLFSGNMGTKIDPGQMLARLKNVLGEASGTFKALQAAGIGQFLNQRRSTQEVQDWAEGQTPQVEVRKFGASEQSPDQKAKKEFSLYGRSGAIFPTAPKGTGKTLAQIATQQAQLLPNVLVKGALDKLDSLKSTGEDILKSITDQHNWKSLLMKQQGYDLPKIEALSPKFADSVSKYANAQVSSALRANSNITQVLGDKLNDEQFRKQLGGVIYEDMRRADGSKGNSVLQLKNSPFATEAQYQAALKNPEIQRALQGWKDLVQKPATEMHEKLGGTLAEVGEKTGAFANLIAVLEDEKPQAIENSPSTVGPLSTMKKASAFSKERQFTGKEYNLDAKDMAFRMLTKNAQQAALRDLYETGEKEGLLKLLKSGEATPEGMNRVKNPVTLRTVVTKDGDIMHTQAFPAFDKKIASTLDQALQLNKSMKDTLDLPLVHQLSQVAIKTQVGLGIDLGFHTFNDMMAVATSPKGLQYIPKKAMEVAKATQDLVSHNPQIQEELAKMAESGVTFRGDSLGGWSSSALKHIDTVTRVVLGREYQQLVKEKKVVNSPAEMRRYVNGRAGQYNKRMMTWLQQGMQETGFGAFNVAGRNFNRLAVNALGFSPGVKATSKMNALRLRASIALGVATAALIIPSTVNIALWGTPQPEGTSLGDIAIHKNKDGTYEVINMRKWTMLARGGRATGIGDIMNEQVIPRLKGEKPATLGHTAMSAARDIATTGLAPYAGPPLNVASAAIKGKSAVGYEQRTPGEKGPPYVAAAVSSLNPLVGPLVNSQGGQTTGSRVAQRLGSIVGIQSSQSPFSIIRNRAEQFKQRNNIGSDSNQSYGPSEYLPLKNALLQGDVEQAKEAYQQLLHDKSQNATLDDEEAKHQAMMSMQKEFSRMENFRFVNKESEAAFQAGLTPQQRDMYNTSVQQQKQIADNFFNQIQAKEESSKPRGFKPMKMRKSRGFSNQF